MAIKRPDSRAAGPQIKKDDSTEAVAVSVLVAEKKKTITRKKSSSSRKSNNSNNPENPDSSNVNKKARIVDKKKPNVNKRSTKSTEAKKKKTTSRSTKAKKAAPPKTEREWINHINEMKFGDLISFMSDNDGKLNVTALSVVNSNITKLTQSISGFPADYNGWLEFFSGMTRNETEQFMETHVMTLDNEAVAAGKRWLEIYDKPSLIDRIVSSRLQQAKTEEVGNILTAAKSGDRVKTFEALRDNLAYKLQDGSGARDMTVLIKQLNEVMVTLDELYRETGQKDDSGSSIRKLLLRSRKMASRPRASQAAATIEDVENMEDDEDMS